MCIGVYQTCIVQWFGHWYRALWREGMCEVMWQVHFARVGSVYVWKERLLNTRPLDTSYNACVRSGFTCENVLMVSR
jgi:hypothetical protein